MVVTCEQMRAAEDRLFSSGQAAEPLMDLAGYRCAEAIRNTVLGPGRAVLFCGKGNNGGDALVVGAWLRKWGWQVDVRFSHPLDQTTNLACKKYREFEEVPDGAGGNSTVLIDGLLGIGAKGALHGAIGNLAKDCNEWRLKFGAITFAIDIPSGIDGDSGEPYEGAVVADHTLSICVPKRGILDERSIDHVGRIHQIALPEIPVSEGDATLEMISPETLRPHLKRRKFDTHKGTAGRVAIIAGSKGLSGAPTLSSLGAINSGAGLVTVFVPEEIYQIVASQAPVEVMVHAYSDSIEEIKNHRADVFAIGPGLGSTINPDILDFATSWKGPVVMDADLLNWISESDDLLNQFPAGKRLLTPHPGELARLADLSGTGDRIETARTLAEKWNVTLLYKGARTVVATPGEVTGINSSGTPAMASGGMGDLLTGMTASFVGRGMSLHEAACTASWCLGRAAEICPPAVTASQVARQLGPVIDALI
ncbi:MAG: NAD(P)H-hydrate dehydratase [Verrucomicrobiales bacterium]|nr:NAD(P)H-hydrate dehydratase [Verrucomicrobiales bacterium]